MKNGRSDFFSRLPRPPLAVGLAAFTTVVVAAATEIAAPTRAIAFDEAMSRREALAACGAVPVSTAGGTEQERAKELYLSIVLPAIDRLQRDFEIAAPARTSLEKIHSRADAYRPLFDAVQRVSTREPGRPETRWRLGLM